MGKRTKKKPVLPVTLRAWAVMKDKDADPFTAPEIMPIRLVGNAFGHPGFGEGKPITTSGVVKVDGRRCTTESGSVYVLDGDPEPAYLDWLASQGRTYDPAQPIAVKSRAVEGRA